MKKKILSLGSILGIASVVPLLVSCSNPTNELKNEEAKIKQLKQEITNLKNKLSDLENKNVTISTELINLASDSKENFLKLVELYKKFKSAEPILDINGEQISIEEIQEEELVYNLSNSAIIRYALEKYTDALRNAMKDFENKYDELKDKYAKLEKDNKELINIINNAGDQIDGIIETSDHLYEEYNRIKDNKETNDERELRLHIKDQFFSIFDDKYQINLKSEEKFSDLMNMLEDPSLNNENEIKLKEDILKHRPDLKERTKTVINVIKVIGILKMFDIVLPSVNYDVLFSLGYAQEYNKQIKIYLTFIQKDKDGIVETMAVNTMYSFIIKNQFGE